MAVFKCKMCGGSLDIEGCKSVVTCEYCGTQQTLPKAEDEVIANLFNRANNLRLKNEFDKAQELYEKIISTGSTDAEAYWGNVLCKFGIEYVEDPATFKRIPTCHRTQLEPVLSDVDYKSAIENADDAQREIYEAEAKAIDELQRNILRIVDGEEPFDVFICYKETDENGKRTQDSVIANDIYHQLTQEGFKVFYAAITLEDKLGQEYEPYIFSALNSAKVMLVVGTKPEFFNAVWVRNEWSRFLKIIKNDRQKALIPCYKDMDAYDLPEEFSHLQAQDMGKIGFISDIVRGIKKIIGDNTPKTDSNLKKVKNDPATVYSRAVASLNNKDADSLELAKKLFDSLGDYKDSKEKSKECAEKIKKKKKSNTLVALLIVAVVVGVVALIASSPIPRAIINALSPNSNQTVTEQQTPISSVEITNLKINRDTDDVSNNYDSFENPISRLYFHYDVVLNGIDSADLLFLMVTPTGKEYEYLETGVYSATNWIYNFGRDELDDWDNGNFQLKIYDNNTNQLLLTKNFSVFTSDNGNNQNNVQTYQPTQAPQVNNVSFETLTFSGQGFSTVNNVCIPNGLYLIKYTATCPSSDNNKFYFDLYNEYGSEVVYEISHIYPDEPINTQQTFEGPINGGKLVIDAESNVSWTITIEIL